MYKKFIFDISKYFYSVRTKIGKSLYKLGVNLPQFQNVFVSKVSIKVLMKKKKSRIFTELKILVSNDKNVKNAGYFISPKTKSTLLAQLKQAGSIKSRPIYPPPPPLLDHGNMP